MIITEEFYKTIFMEIKPLEDRLVIEGFNETATTASGIVLPDTAGKEKPQKGKVIAIGEGRITQDGKRIPMTVKVGDTVLFRKYGPDEVKIDGKELLIMSESDILSII